MTTQHPPKHPDPKHDPKAPAKPAPAPAGHAPAKPAGTTPGLAQGDRYKPEQEDPARLNPDPEDPNDTRTQTPLDPKGVSAMPIDPSVEPDKYKPAPPGHRDYVAGQPVTEQDLDESRARQKDHMAKAKDIAERAEETRQANEEGRPPPKAPASPPQMSSTRGGDGSGGGDAPHSER